MISVNLPIAGFEGRYVVSRDGRVHSLKAGRDLRPFKAGRGYMMVTLCDGGAMERRYVHRIVAAAFVPPSLGGTDVNHIDVDRIASGEPSTMITLSLPFPPSANRLWRAVRGRQIKSAEYRSWLLEAQAAITEACIGGSMPGAYHLEIHATRPDRRARDIDNLIKPISDAIAAAGLVLNDSAASSVFAIWSSSEPLKGGAITVNLRPA